MDLEYLNQSYQYIDLHTHSAGHENNTFRIRNVDLNSNLDLSGSEEYFSAGFHPWYLRANKIKEAKIKLARFLEKKKVIAIGECGLDSICDTNLDLQREYFLLQLDESEKRKLPVIIHCVKEYSSILKIRKDNNYTQPWIFHGFGGSRQLYIQIVESGCYVSLGSRILSPGKKFREMLEMLSLNSIFIETDEAENQTDELYRELARLKNIELQTLVSAIKANFELLFGRSLNAE